MNDQEYSNREIDAHFQEVYHRLDDVNNNLAGLNAKVAIQNGKVGKLEAKSAWVTGVGVGIVFLFSIVAGLIVYSFNLSQENLKQSILLELHDTK